MNLYQTVKNTLGSKTVLGGLVALSLSASACSTTVTSGDYLCEDLWGGDICVHAENRMVCLRSYGDMDYSFLGHENFTLEEGIKAIEICQDALVQ